MSLTERVTSEYFNEIFSVLPIILPLLSISKHLITVDINVCEKIHRNNTKSQFFLLW